MSSRHVIFELEPDTAIERVGVRIGRETLWLDVTGIAPSDERCPSRPDDGGPHISFGDFPSASSGGVPDYPAKAEFRANDPLSQGLVQRRRNVRWSAQRNDD